MKTPGKKILKIGIIGAGSIVRERHAPGLLSLEGVEIAAVANQTREKALAFCREFSPQAEAIDHWRDLVTRPDLDIIWIGTHPNLHREITLAALDSGKHVFCQARMATNLIEAEEMLQAAEAKPQFVTMLCPPPQGLRQDAFMRQLLLEKFPGKPRRVRVVSRNGAFLNSKTPPHWRQLRETSGLNVLSLGIHVEVLQRWFGNIASVQAASRIWTPERNGFSIEIPDELFVIADFSCNILGTLDLSGTDPGPGTDFIEITGEDGLLRCDYLTGEITFQKKGEEITQPLPLPSNLDRPWQVEKDFINAVRNPEAPRPHPTFRDGVAYMRVVQAVHDSLERGSKVHLTIPN